MAARHVIKARRAGRKHRRYECTICQLRPLLLARQLGDPPRVSGRRQNNFLSFPFFPFLRGCGWFALALAGCKEATGEAIRFFRSGTLYIQPHAHAHSPKSASCYASATHPPPARSFKSAAPITQFSPRTKVEADFIPFSKVEKWLIW